MKTFASILLLCLAVLSVAIGRQAVAQAPAKKSAIIEFVQDGCGPCETMKPIVAKIQAAGIRVVVHKTSATDPVGLTLGIKKTPTFMAVTAEGRFLRRIEGPTTEAKLLALAADAQAN